jgi:carbamoyltransferase
LTKILGVSCYYHDAAAALIEDGRVIVAAEEERFTRRKHDSGLPRNAIRFCLDYTQTSPEALDRVVFYDKPLKKLERALQSTKAHGQGESQSVDWHLQNYVHRESRLTDDLHDVIGAAPPVQFCEHHLSHAASAFYMSPFEEAAIVTVDGVGEWATTGVYVGEGAQIRQLKEIRYPHSLGLYYAAMTAYLGFEVNEGEYKVMGLASYGKPSFDQKITQLLRLHQDGSFENNLEYFSYMHDEKRMYTQSLVNLLGPARDPTEPVTDRHRDIAASMQKLCEEALINLARSVREETGLQNLCMAGGVAHNVVANSRILAEGGFTDLWIQPASGDSGGAVGGALYSYHAMGGPRQPAMEYDTCLGPSFSNEIIKEALGDFGAEYELLDEAELVTRTADLINQNLVVGWFQGRMEFGPRALGCRSILANPCQASMKETLNARIKFREEFRPFAPAALEEYANLYFELEGRSPYMLYCPRVRPDKRSVIPAVTHVDGTARVQTVSKTMNPRFHALIEAFRQRSGVPVVINTSFNVKGEPIVCTPSDALKCFYGTDIDALAIGDFIVWKSY